MRHLFWLETKNIFQALDVQNIDRLEQDIQEMRDLLDEGNRPRDYR